VQPRIAQKIAGILVLFTSIPNLQSQPPGAQTFSAASIRLSKSADARGRGFKFLPGGKVSATNIPIYRVIAEAWNLAILNESARLSGGPDWLRSDGYDIEATPELGVVASRDQARLMLQHLLADRFRLTIRPQTKDLPFYAVTVPKSGPKLQKANIDPKDCLEGAPVNGITCHQIGGGMGRGVHGQAIDLGDLAGFVENWSDRPVIDKTVLTGLFAIETDGWTPMRPRPVRDPSLPPSAEDLAMADPARPTLFMIFDKLGLKLEPRKGPVETFVIEHVERPTEN